MLHFLTTERIVENIRALEKALGVSAAEPRAAYFESLKRLQELPLFPGEWTPRAIVDASEAEYQPLFEYFRKGLGAAASVVPIPPDERQEERLAEACALLSRLNPSVDRAVYLLIAQVVMLRSPDSEGGGSAADSLGTIWMRPGRDWTALEFAESLWHETTHQALLLEELTRDIFAESAEAMSMPNALVSSAVWPYTQAEKARRPYFAAFHSACVAVELSTFFARTDRPDRAQNFLNGAHATSVELRARCQYLSPSGAPLLADLENVIARELMIE